MKSVLISIQPKWCEKICNIIGYNADNTPIYEKTIEVRKTKPKLETPFKVYIYCTQGKEQKELFKKLYKHIPLNNKVIIGEFVCDEIETLCEKRKDGRYVHKIIDRIAVEKYAAMTIDEFWDYVGLKQCYAWHISNLVIYDKPKELGEFKIICEGLKPYQCEKCEYSYTENTESGSYAECCCNNLKPLTRPPQSWCYVEEVETK